MYKSFLKTSIFLLLFVGGINNIFSQDVNDDSRQKSTVYSVFIHSSKTLNSENNSNRSSKVGIGFDIDKKINSNVSILIRTVWRPWNYDPESIIHIAFAPKYTFHLSERISLSPFIGIGPSLVLGNDYGLIAASSTAGIKFSYDITEKNSIFIGSAVNQAMSFHSDHFEFVEFFFGIDFY